MLSLKNALFAVTASAALDAMTVQAQNFDNFHLIERLARPSGIPNMPVGLGADLSSELNSVNEDVRLEARSKIAESISLYSLPSVDIEIEFAFGSDKLGAAAMVDLQEVAIALNSPQLFHSKIMVAGHTDAVGAAEYNLDLSQRRARSVCDYLISSLNVPREKLIAVGFGSERLKDFIDPEAAVNRRVEFVNVTGIID